MPPVCTRRSFLAGALSATPSLALAQGRISRRGASRILIGLNAYSFHQPLRDGTMTLFDVLDYCVAQDIYALDATGYYFPNYPSAPPDNFLFELKRQAFLHGIAITGSGVRNDFALPELARRRAQQDFVKTWIEVAAKLGASVLRVFSGLRPPPGATWEETFAWIADSLRECAAHGARHGVIIGVQHHNDFLQTAAQTIRLIEAVNSPWCGVILDVGSLRQGDPYEEIERLCPYAVTWQFKETVWSGDKEVPIDLKRMRAIIERARYRGILPLETLGAGDPRQKVAAFRARVREVFGL